MEQYIKAFNEGYTLAKYEPLLLNTITKNLKPTTIYIEGLISGQEQYNIEYSKENLSDLENLRHEGNERELGRQ